jgi:hypothetical protein
VQSRQDGGFYPTLGRVAQNERDRERETRKLNGGCSVVGGPSGVSTGRQKPKARCAVTSVIQSPTGCEYRDRGVTLQRHSANYAHVVAFAGPGNKPDQALFTFGLLFCSR